MGAVPGLGNQIIKNKNLEEILQELERRKGFPIAKIARLPVLCEFGMCMYTHLSLVDTLPAHWARE